MRKIAVICTLYGPHGGTGRVTTEIIERYASDGNEVHIFCADYDNKFAEKSLVSSITKLNITNVGLLKQIDILRKASKVVKAKDYDIIYTTGDYHFNPDIVTIHILKKQGRKTIEALEKRGAIGRTNSRIKNILRKIYCPLVYEIGEQFVYRKKKTLFICVSDGVKREFCSEFGHMADRVLSIPNAVDYNEYRYNAEKRRKIRKKLNINEDRKVILFAGSDWARKRLDVAIGVIAKFALVELVVAGHDNPLQYIEMAKMLKCQDRVHFVGFRNDIADFYSAADYFLFTSVYETFGLVALEAMAAGAIVISNRLNGVEDFINNGKNGFLTEDNTIESFSKIMQYILDNPQIEKMIRENAVDTAKSLNWESCYQEYKKIFDSYQRRGK